MQKTILIVDDDLGLLKILTIVFERAHYEVMTATSGEEAMKLVHSMRPDAVLMDDMMPGIPGTQVCKILKNDPETSRIPIVIYSAGPDILNRAYLDEIGADASLRKPCDHRIIIETIDRTLAASV